MNWQLGGILIYVLAQVAIGIAVSHKSRDEADFLLAGRSLGLGVTTFSVFSTWFGAETCMGAAGRAYDNGWYGVSADPFGFGLCLLAFGLVFAYPLWRRKIFTMADLFRSRFSPSVERLVAVLLIPVSLMWGAAQVRAFGSVLSTSSEAIPLHYAVFLAAVLSVAYTAFGGMLAAATASVVQSIAIVIGLGVMWVVVVSSVGGVDEAFAMIKRGGATRIPPELPDDMFFHALTALFGSTELPTRIVKALTNLEVWFIPIIGGLASQELVTRAAASKSGYVARNACLLGGIVYISVGMMPVTLGMLGPELVPGLEFGEQILPVLAQKYLNTVLYVVFAGALVSAILSTVSSCLLVCSTLLAHNIIFPLRKDLRPVQKVVISQGGVALFGLLAWVIAINAEAVYTLVVDASAVSTAGVVVCFLFGLYTGIGARVSAIASLLVGITTYAFVKWGLELGYPFVFSLAAALIAYLAFASVRVKGEPTPKPAGIFDEPHTAHAGHASAS